MKRMMMKVTFFTSFYVVHCLALSNQIGFRISLTNMMILHGFHLLPSDPCILRNEVGKKFIFWVDDIIIIAPTLHRITKIKTAIS